MFYVHSKKFSPIHPTECLLVWGTVEGTTEGGPGVFELFLGQLLSILDLLQMGASLQPTKPEVRCTCQNFEASFSSCS